MISIVDDTSQVNTVNAENGLHKYHILYQFGHKPTQTSDHCSDRYISSVGGMALNISPRRDIREAVREKKDDLQSGSSSWCTKCFSSQVVPAAASSRRL